MTQTSGANRLLEKLQLRHRPLLLIGCPREIRPLFKGAVLRDELPEDGAPEAVLAFVTSKLAAEAVIHAVLPSCTADTLLWFAYPKQSSKRYTADISRNSGWAAFATYGYEPDTQISINSDWAALRFRPFNEIRQSRPEGQP